MSEVTPRDREEKLLAAIAEGTTGKLPTPRNRKEKLLKEIYDHGGTGGGGTGGVTPEQVKAILLANTDNALNGASSNPIANKALVAALADYVKSTDLSIPTKVSELINDKKYQTDSDLVTALTPYAKSDDVTAEIIAEIAKVVAGAPEDLNTLKEMSDWIAGHENDASAMNSAISDNKTSITALQTGKADKSEIPTTVAELTDSADYAKKTDLHSHDNKSVLDEITSDKVTAWDNKSEFSGSYNDLNDKPTIDAELSNTSENAIQNKVVTKEINKLYSDISFNDHDTATSGTSFTDAEDGNMIVTDWTRNLLNPTLETVTQNGITCTNNGDGTYTLNGTSTGQPIFWLNENVNVTGSNLKLVCCPPNMISNEEVYSQIMYDNNEWGEHESGDGVVINSEKKILKVIFTLNSGYTVNNLVIKPMLTTDLNATYDDFVPYSGYDIQSCGKNLVNVDMPTNTNNGVVCTNNGDGTYTLNGTATDETLFSLIKYSANRSEIYKRIVGKNVLFLNGGHKLNEDCRILLNFSDSSYNKWYYEKYDGDSFVVPSGYDFAVIDIHISRGATVNNLVVKPMITLDLDATNDDFISYQDGGTVHIDSTTEFPLLGLKSFDDITNIISPGNVKCVYPTNESGKGVLDSLYNKDKMLTEQNKSLEVLGKCKNLLNSTFNTDTHNGITFTRNDDGTYSLSGSRTDTSISAYTTFIIDYPLEKGRYKLTGALDENNNIRCIIKESGSENKNIYDYGKGAVLDISKPNTTITLMIVSIDDTSQTRIVKPMLTTDLSATYDDFVPYTGDGETLASDVAEIKNDLGGLTFSASGTTLTITDGTHTWTLGANS